MKPAGEGVFADALFYGPGNLFPNGGQVSRQNRIIHSEFWLEVWGEKLRISRSETASVQREAAGRGRETEIFPVGNTLHLCVLGLAIMWNTVAAAIVHAHPRAPLILEGKKFSRIQFSVDIHKLFTASVLCFRRVAQTIFQPKSRQEK